MRREVVVERLKGLAAALAFAGFGLFLRWADGPPVLGWLLIGFGTLGVLGIVAVTLNPKWAARSDSGESPSVVLKDGRDYRVDVSEVDVVMTHLKSADVQRRTWSDVTAIWTIAIDGYPAGRISWILHTNGATMEIPWDVQGSKELLAKMQEKFPDLDNTAIIESAGMLHGFRQLWPPTSAKG